MTTTFPQFQQTVPWMLAAVLLGQPELLRAENAPDPVVDLPHERRMLVSAGSFALEAAVRERAASAVAGGIVPRSLMLHRFTAELVDPAGRSLSLAGRRWGATLHLTRQSTGMPILLVQLGTESHRMVLPKLLAYRIDAGDTLELRVVMLDAPDTVGIHMRVWIDYEALDGPVSRWAVVPAGLELNDVSDTECSWEWTAGGTGRVLALAGLPLHGATELIVRNAATGAVVWRMSVPPTDAAAFARPASFVRLGIHTVEGETYRLTVSYDREVVRATVAAAGVQVMLLAGRIGDDRVAP